VKVVEYMFQVCAHVRYVIDLVVTWVEGQFQHPQLRGVAEQDCQRAFFESAALLLHHGKISVFVRIVIAVAFAVVTERHLRLHDDAQAPQRLYEMEKIRHPFRGYVAVIEDLVGHRVQGETLKGLACEPRSLCYYMSLMHPLSSPVDVAMGKSHGRLKGRPHGSKTLARIRRQAQVHLLQLRAFVEEAYQAGQLQLILFQQSLVLDESDELLVGGLPLVFRDALDPLLPLSESAVHSAHDGAVRTVRGTITVILLLPPSIIGRRSIPSLLVPVLVGQSRPESIGLKMQRLYGLCDHRVARYLNESIEFVAMIHHRDFLAELLSPDIG